MWLHGLQLAITRVVSLSAEAGMSAVYVQLSVLKTAVAGWRWCQLHFPEHLGVESVVARASIVS